MNENFESKKVIDDLLAQRSALSVRKLLLGTDWWTDADDVIAMQLLAWAHKNKIVELVGVGINACMEHSAPSVCAYLEDSGIENIRIGIDFEANDFTGTPKYQKRMAAFSKRIKKNEDAENAVRMYRSILACATEKIDIAEIGFCQLLSGVLESGPDDISPLDGKTLFETKVRKVWVMAGKWDVDGGREHNFDNNERARNAAEKFCRLCPCEVTFLGWEIGNTVISGSRLKGRDTFTANALFDNLMANGRSSWDPMLVLLALIGDEEKAGYTTVRGKASVDASDGSNHFAIDEKGKHRFVVKTKDDKWYSDIIDEILDMPY